MKSGDVFSSDFIDELLIGDCDELLRDQPRVLGCLCALVILLFLDVLGNRTL